MKPAHKLPIVCSGMLLVALLIPAGCKKKDTAMKMEFSYTAPVPPAPTPTVAPPEELPKLSTDSVTTIGPATVVCSASIISSGTSSISARGFCWGTQPDPTINNARMVIGNGTGAYQGLIRALLPNTTYYVRAYATNNSGTAYGNNRVFTTSALAAGTVADADGNIYQTVKIGKQEWLLENLRSTTFQNGDPIPHIENDASWNQDIKGAYSYFNYDDRTVQDRGLFYNFFVLEDPRKIGPAGWHVPSQAEWDTLAGYLGGLNVAGGKLKDVSGWNAPNQGATNESGFTGRGNGFRNITGATQNVGLIEYFWTTNPVPGNIGNIARLHAQFADLSISGILKNAGCHIRCVKD